MSPDASKILPASDENIAQAARVIAEGGLVAFPTETVYGLGADASSDRAVAAIYAAKARPRFNPLIVHFADLAAAQAAAEFDVRAEALARRFWPGALTLVLRRRRDCPVSLLACAGLDTVAVRIPAHQVALKLLKAAGRPLAAPSANPSGAVSPTTAAHVAESLGDKVALILDGGPCRIGVESTVIDLSGDEARLLRPGGVARADIEAVIGPLAAGGEDAAAPRSPGLALQHYAPSLPLRLDARGGPERPGEALLAFGAEEPPGYAAVRNLSPGSDLSEAAANLFAMLRELDRPEFAGVAVMPIPETGLGEAINDRLRRAAEMAPGAARESAGPKGQPRRAG